MAFTDKDLELIKIGGAVTRSFLYQTSKIAELVKRLEVAEAVLEELNGGYTCDCNSLIGQCASCYRIYDLIQEWRKSAGKE